MKKWLYVMVLAIFTLPIFAQDSNGGIIYGRNWSYIIKAPTGYEWDSESLQKNGIWGLFWESKQGRYIPQKHNMFINPVMKGNGYPTDLQSLIDWDIDFYKENTPGLVVNYYKDFNLGDGKIAKAYTFDDANRGYYSISAYVCEENASFVFVLVDRSKEDRQKHELSYAELLKSFIYANKN